MDTSETYIKMCEKAEVIQGDRELLEGDYYAYLRPIEGETWCHKTRQEHIDRNIPPSIVMLAEDEDCKVNHWYTDNIERCWLPRQDQLQEMVECWSYGVKWKKESDNLIKLERFYQFVNEGNVCLFRKETSFEQYWLAFVMKEKHNKIWSGEDWSS